MVSSHIQTNFHAELKRGEGEAQQNQIHCFITLLHLISSFSSHQSSHCKLCMLISKGEHLEITDTFVFVQTNIGDPRDSPVTLEFAEQMDSTMQAKKSSLHSLRCCRLLRDTLPRLGQMQRKRYGCLLGTASNLSKLTQTDIHFGQPV